LEPGVALTRDVAGFASIAESTKNGRDCVIASVDIEVSIVFSFRTDRRPPPFGDLQEA
jgi:hypothetical protein